MFLHTLKPQRGNMTGTHPDPRCCSPAGSSGGQTWLSGSAGWCGRSNTGNDSSWPPSLGRRSSVEEQAKTSHLNNNENWKLYSQSFYKPEGLLGPISVTAGWMWDTSWTVHQSRWDRIKVASNHFYSGLLKSVKFDPVCFPGWGKYSLSQLLRRKQSGSLGELQVWLCFPWTLKCVHHQRQVLQSCSWVEPRLSLHSFVEVGGANSSPVSGPVFPAVSDVPSSIQFVFVYHIIVIYNKTIFVIMSEVSIELNPLTKEIIF